MKFTRWDNATVEERFWAKVEKLDNGCWVYTSALTEKGYGRFKADKAVLAHVFSWRLLVGPVPEGYELDHLCRNRACVNPAHLEPVTHLVNLLRSRCCSWKHNGFLCAGCVEEERSLAA